MRKPISRRQHGVAEYTYIPTALAAPALMGFKGNETASRLARVVGGVVALSAVFTRAEWGLVKAVPFKAHLAADVAAGLLVAGAPWLFGFADDDRARKAFVGLGLVSVAAGLLTRAEEMPRSEA